MSESALDIRNLTFSYDGEPALKDVSLAVLPGSTLSVIGPNGAGKTTLVKIVLGELAGYQGQVEVFGHAPSELPALGIVGYVPQYRTGLKDFPLTTSHLVMLGLARRRGLFRRFGRADRKAALEALSAVEMEKYASRPIDQLSGGQMQRVCIARALVARPRLLILDEPTVGIDEAGQQRFIALIGRLKQLYSLTVIMVSHDIRTVASLSDMIACLNVTLHYHDHPARLDRQTLFNVFHCDFEAMHEHLHLKGLCIHDQPQGRADSEEAAHE